MNISEADDPVEQLLLDASILLLEPSFGQGHGETNSLRSQMAELLKDLRAYKQGLEETRKANRFGTDPILAGRIFTLQAGIAGVRTTVDVDVVPRLRSLNDSLAPPGPMSESTRLAQLLDSLAQARNAGGQPRGQAALGKFQVAQAAHGIDLLGTLSAPGVGRLLSSFEQTFETARTHIGRLRTYKGLHDQLHQLQIAFFDFLETLVIRVAPPRIASDDDYEDVGRYAGRIADEIVQAARDIARHGGLRSGEVAWLGELEELCSTMTAASERHDLRTIAKQVRAMDHLIATRSTALNQRLITVAEFLPLGDLEHALDEVVSLIPPEATQDVDALTVSRTALTTLHQGLDRLVDEHDRWQGIDSELRDIGAMLAGDREGFAQRWREQHERIVGLCGEQAADWIDRMLRLDVPRLEKAIEAADPDPVALAKAFREYRSRANRGFFLLDKKLLEACIELAKLDGPLMSLLGRIHDDRGGDL